MNLELDPKDAFNFSSANVLLISESAFNMGILYQAMSGLGFGNLEQCKRMDAARDLMGKQAFDLIVIEAANQSTEGYELVKWLRTEVPPPGCFAPVMITTAHIPMDTMMVALDSGCDMVVKKPFTPNILLERIVWMGRPDRQFVYSDGYVGPERQNAQSDPMGTNAPQQVSDDFFDSIAV